MSNVGMSNVPRQMYLSNDPTAKCSFGSLVSGYFDKYIGHGTLHIPTFDIGKRENTMSTRLGFMLRVPNGDDLESRYRDALELVVAADQLGFDSFWVTQHHFGSVDCPLSSPLVFLAAAAARTKSIRLGTTVITASLENPIRLAEDAATLDVISGGRVELGLGTSTNPLERAAFGICAEGQLKSCTAWRSK
jgi:hypothetical protein